jgi:hypothetical protein
VIAGGCHCGWTRYSCDEPYVSAVHCHCGMCRKSSGAAFMTWVSLPRRAFRIDAGQPAVRETSSGVKRAFCRDCGAQLFMDYADSPTIDVSAGTLDHPEAIEVRENIWTEARLLLAKGFDADLPSHAGASPES